MRGTRRLPRRRITAKQRRLIQDIAEIQRIFVLDPETILRDHEPESWTTRLELAVRQLMGSQVVADYTLINEYLNAIVANFFFGPERSFVALWRKKSFRLFNHHILEELSLLKKLHFAHAIKPIPSAVRRDIERLNALRNSIAHSFFRKISDAVGPVWKGQNIFTRDGVSRYREDI